MTTSNPACMKELIDEYDRLPLRGGRYAYLVIQAGGEYVEILGFSILKDGAVALVPVRPLEVRRPR